MAQTSPSRMTHLDNLRSFVVLLVVVMHSNVTYSGMGSWYYTEGREANLDVLSRLVFALYGCFNQAWFMGILFFISGYLAARALAKRGPAAFVKERLFRLGAPLLLYMLVVHPLTVFAFLDHGRFHAMGLTTFYLGFLREGHVLSATGPLWYAQALLIFCLLLAVLRSLKPAPRGASQAPPGAFKLVVLALGTGLFAFLIRLHWPIGTSVLNLQFCFFASYIALFTLGVRGAERGWFDALAETSSRGWLWVGLAGIPAWFVLILSTGVLRGQPLHIAGGPHWQAAAYALWEALVAIAMSIAMVGLFRRRAAWENRFTRLLSANCFRIYMFHTPILVGISVALSGWHAPMLAKHAVVAPLACLASLALSEWVLRRIPGLENITR